MAIEDIMISDLLEKIAQANKTIDHLKKIKKLNKSPLVNEIDALIEKVTKAKDSYVKKYDEIYAYICAEADFISYSEE